MKAEVMEMRVRFAPHLKLRLGEWFASVILASMGLVLLLWPSIINGKIFPVMREFAGAAGWTVIFLGFGFSRIIALWINGRNGITPYVRMAMSFLSCFVWWQVTISFFLSGHPALIWGVFPWFLALDMYNVFQASGDARDVYDASRIASNGLGKA